MVLLAANRVTHFWKHPLLPGSRKSETTEKPGDLIAEVLQGAGTHTACRGDRPGLLSLSLLLVCSIAPFCSSRIALARLPRVGFPMEAVVYRGILFSAIEACHQPKENV